MCCLKGNIIISGTVCCSIVFYITSELIYSHNFFRGLPELKEKVANCVGLIGGILGNEAGRYSIMTVIFLCVTQKDCRASDFSRYR